MPNTDVVAQGSFQFKVTDTATGGTSATSAAATMSLNVTADGGPTAGASSVSLTEDHTYTFKATDFVYSDSADASTDSLASITIVTLPSSGTLKLGINNVTAGQVITAASIPNLTYVPNTDVAGAAGPAAVGLVADDDVLLLGGQLVDAVDRPLVGRPVVDEDHLVLVRRHRLPQQRVDEGLDVFA